VARMKTCREGRKGKGREGRTLSSLTYYKNGGESVTTKSSFGEEGIFPQEENSSRERGGEEALSMLGRQDRRLGINAKMHKLFSQGGEKKGNTWGRGIETVRGRGKKVQSQRSDRRPSFVRSPRQEPTEKSLGTS